MQPTTVTSPNKCRVANTESEVQSMKKMNYCTETYAVDDTYCIDIVNTGTEYEAWVYRKDYGVKVLMYGISVDGITYERFVKISGINAKSYIEVYQREEEVC